MRRISVARVMTLFATIACGVVVVPSVAGADPGNGNGATVIRAENGICEVVIPTAHWVSKPCSLQTVTVPDGTTNIHGTGQVDESHSSPLPDTGINVKTDSCHGTVTPSGRLTVDCHGLV